MGVDFYGCSKCGDSKYSEYVNSCQGCGNSLCTSCLVNDDINDRFAHSYGVQFEEDRIEEIAKSLGEKVEAFKDREGNFYYEEGDIIDDTAIQEKYCPFCSGDTINNEDLLAFILQEYKLDAKEEWNKYKNK